MQQSEIPSSSLVWYKQNTKCYDDNDDHRPKPRSCHTMTVVGTNAFLFGGMTDSTADDSDDADDCAQASRELFRLDVSNKTNLEWKKIPETGLQPLARWRHSATLFDNTQILIFGGFATSDHRLNDVWVFDAVGYTWSQPNPKHNQEATVPCQLTNNQWANVPPPRASHSATLIGESIYIFGGYGGLGYGRRDLDDLYSLNVNTWSWSKVLPKGSAPEKRSGHQACAIEKKIYIFGGSNSSTQFQDVYVLDLELDPPLWSKLNCMLPSPVWNSCSCSVIAIPTWKIFTFGGITGMLSDFDRQGKMVSSTEILDTGTERWTEPKIEGRAPSPRSDTCLAYDPKGSRLIVFGGWADDWLDDLYTLDVGNIVGPPYAITGMHPYLGPVTGGTEISIFGIDFINTKNVIVRFGNMRNFIDAVGVFVSQSKITCVSPNASKFPPGEVDVRISLEGDSFTTTFQRYGYFSVTNAASCIMYGPGLLSGCAAGEEVAFVIQARDDSNSNRTTGGDEFSVVITMREDDEDVGTEENNKSNGSATGSLNRNRLNSSTVDNDNLDGTMDNEESENGNNNSIRVQGILIEDLENGRYLVTYIAKYAGRYRINVDFMGTFGGKAGPLRGSGLEVDFFRNVPRENNHMSGDLVIRSLREDVRQLQVLTEEVSRNVLVRVKDDSWSNEEQIQVLMRVKESLLRVEAVADETTLLVERSECVLKYLVDENIMVGNLEEVLNASKFLWEKILREAPHIQTKIAPMMRTHSNKIKQDIQSYEHRIKAYKVELSKAEYYTYATGTKKALELLEGAERVHKIEAHTCDKMMHIATIFECAKEMEVSIRLMGQISELLADFKVLWEVNQKVAAVVEDSRKMTWANLDTEVLEDSAKGLVQSLRKLPKTVRQSDAYQGMDRSVKEFVVTCPIITSLRSPAMRERHWKELMLVVKKEFTLQPQMPLKDLLDLALHKHATDVDEITDRAMKEAKHEDTLANLEATWGTVDFSMILYKSTDVPLLKLEDEIVEQLESDQMAVQSIVGSRYGHFKAGAADWQRTLGLVSDVSQLLSEIQRTWSYLEPLFIGSEEVRKELPDDAKRFQNIDAQVKIISF